MLNLQAFVLVTAALAVTSSQAQQTLFDAPVRNPGQKQLCNPCIDPPINHSGPGTNFDSILYRSIMSRDARRASGGIRASDIVAQLQAQTADRAPGQCVKTDIAGGPTFQFEQATETWGDTWYGTRSFAVLLRADLVYGPGDKFFWYSDGFRPGQASDLNVTIRRAGDGEGSAAVLASTNALFDDRRHMLTGINFPDAGCWQISAEYHGQQLTFVVESTGR